jgi:hypothetical protein
MYVLQKIAMKLFTENGTDTQKSRVWLMNHILRPENVWAGPNSSIFYVDNDKTLTSLLELYTGCSEFLCSVIFFS